jgi:hypothetical protein
MDDLKDTLREIARYDYNVAAALDRIEALERVFALVVADIEGQWAVPAPKQPACLCSYTVDAIRALKEGK